MSDSHDYSTKAVALLSIAAIMKTHNVPADEAVGDDYDEERHAIMMENGISEIDAEALLTADVALLIEPGELELSHADEVDEEEEEDDSDEDDDDEEEGVVANTATRRFLEEERKQRPR